MYRPADHYNFLALGHFHAHYGLGMDFSSRDSDVAKNAGRHIIEYCEREFHPFTLPNGARISIDDLKTPNFFDVSQKIHDPLQNFFAMLGWAAASVHAAPKALDGGECLFQKARNALFTVHNVDFGGVENAIAILREIDANFPWALADAILQRQRTSI
jgi:hypothetical protein